MTDFRIKRGPLADIYNFEEGRPNPLLIIEKGCWYLCTDTADLFLGTAEIDEDTGKPIIDKVTGEEKLTLKQVNGNRNKGLVSKPSQSPSIDMSILSEYAKLTDIPDVSKFLSEIPSEFITERELDERGYLTEHQSLNEYAKKTELFSKSYNDLTDKPGIPSIEGLASETYVDEAVANVKQTTVNLSNYALKSEVSLKANEIPFTTSKVVTKAVGNFAVDDDVRGLTVAEIFAKLLGLEDGAAAEGIIEEIIAYEIPMYSVATDGTVTKIPFNHMKFTVETASAEPTTSGFYQIVSDTGEVLESGYQEIQISSDDVYYIIALPGGIDYNTMVTVQGYNTAAGTWAEIEKPVMISDPVQVEALCSEAGIDISHIDASTHTVWASETCPTGSKLRYIINENKEVS